MVLPKRGPTPERLVSLPDLAKVRGVPYSTLWRTLRALADADTREQGRCLWLFSSGPRRKWWVNLSRLAVAHPALFHQRFVGREEFESLAERVASVEEGQRDLRKRTQAIAGSVRDVREGVTRLKAG